MNNFNKQLCLMIIKYRHQIISAFAYAMIWISFGVVVFVQVIGHRPIGLADNGDYGRMMYIFGLSSEASTDYDRYFNYLNLKYTYEPMNGYNTGYLSSQALLIWLSLQFFKLINPNNTLFDIRYLGLTQAIFYCFVAGLVGFVLYRINRWWGFALYFLFGLMFCDAGYIQYFNSFYIEGGTLIWLIGLAGSGLMVLVNSRKFLRKKYIWLILYNIFTILIVTAKQQYTPLVFIFAFIGVFLTHEVFPAQVMKKIGFSTLTCVILSIVAILYFNNSVPISVRKANSFNSVFNGMLQVSPDPIKDLRALGVEEPTSLLPLIGSNYWQTEALQGQLHMEETFFSKVGVIEILHYYISKPDRMLSLLNLVSSNSLELSIPYLGNFSKADSIKPRERSDQFVVWSKFRAKYFWQGFLGISFPLFAAFILSVIIGLLFNNVIKRIALFSIGFPIMAWFQILIAAIGDGVYEIVKHLFFFNILFDLSLLFTLGLTMVIIERKIIRQN